MLDETTLNDDPLYNIEIGSWRLQRGCRTAIRRLISGLPMFGALPGRPTSETFRRRDRITSHLLEAGLIVGCGDGFSVTESGRSFIARHPQKPAVDERGRETIRKHFKTIGCLALSQRLGKHPMQIWRVAKPLGVVGKSRRPYLPEEEAFLLVAWKIDRTWCAMRLGRAEHAVYCKAVRMGLSPRVERRGGLRRVWQKDQSALTGALGCGK